MIEIQSIVRGLWLIIMADMKVARPFIEFYMLDEVTQDLDLSTLKLLPTSNINSRFDESISDLVYSCRYKDDTATNGKSEARIIILVEHQSTPDKFMPIRVYDYIFGLWINELKANNKIEQLPACHALVFYHGEQTPYPDTMDLTDCIDDPEDRKRWFSQIKSNLAKAKVAVLLLSTDFFASDFIHQQELPDIFSAMENEGLTIISLIVNL